MLARLTDPGAEVFPWNRQGRLENFFPPSNLDVCAAVLLGVSSSGDGVRDGRA